MSARGRHAGDSDPAAPPPPPPRHSIAFGAAEMQAMARLGLDDKDAPSHLHGRATTLPHGFRPQQGAGAKEVQPPPPRPPRAHEVGAGAGGSHGERHSSLPAMAMAAHHPRKDDDDDDHAYEYQDMAPKSQGAAPPAASASTTLGAGLGFGTARDSMKSATLSPPSAPRSARPSMLMRQVTFEMDETKYVGEPWYHGNLSREDAERRMREHGLDDGLFLVRTSSHGVSSLAITVSHGDKILHHKLEVSPDGQYLFVGNTRKFPSLAALIDYYVKTPDEPKYRLKRYLRVIPI